MSREKSKEELIQHKTASISAVSSYLEALIKSDDSKLQGKADKLSYWLTDWITFLDFEPDFSPQSLRRYKRGEIVKVHLGFNIGSEEGGLHYAVVLDKNNAKSSPVLTIVPLTSVKPHTDINRLKSGSIYLGNELFTNLNAKISSTNKHIADELALLEEIVSKMDDTTSVSERIDATDRIQCCQDELAFLNRMRKEVLKMRIGSIALTNQITTVSKIRIYDPKTDHDILSNVC